MNTVKNMDNIDSFSIHALLGNNAMIHIMLVFILAVLKPWIIDINATLLYGRLQSDVKIYM